MKHLESLLLLALLSITIGTVAHAQTAPVVSVTSTVGWTAPTSDANGVPLAGSQNAITGYNIYVGTSPFTSVPASPSATAPATATSAVVTTSAPVGATLYFAATACDAIGCSALSSTATKVVVAPASVDNPPTSVTVVSTTVTTTTSTTTTSSPSATVTSSQVPAKK